MTGFMLPEALDQAARVMIEGESGRKEYAFVDPYTGQLLGYLPRGDFGNLPAMEFIRHLHSFEYFGWLGNRLVEVVASLSWS